MSGMNAAKYAVEQGWKVVPVQVWLTSTGGKGSQPYVKWSNGGSNDWETVRDWWAQWPDAVVGILTKESGLLVIDLDLHHDDANGIESWEAILGQYNGGEIPETFTVRTPTGGTHLYFRNTDERLKNSASKLGPGIDTRGAGDKKGGLIYGPGSVRFDGEYTVENAAPVADLPKWLADLLAPVEAERRPGGTEVWGTADPTRRFTLDQAREFCVKYGLEPLVAAQNGTRNNTLNVAAKVMGHFGPEFWPREFAEEKLRDCCEQIGYADADEIDATIRSGLDAADWLATLVTPEAEQVERESRFDRDVAELVHKRKVSARADQIIKAETRKVRIRDRILSRARLAEIPGVEPLIDNFLFKRSVAVVYGRRNVGKTFAALDMALSVATGRKWAGDDDEAWIVGEDMGFEVCKGTVLWVAGEGAYGIRSRVSAWEKQHGLQVEDFHVLNGSVELANEDTTDELCAIVAEERYDLVVIDTLARNSNGLEENSATDMGTFFERIDRIKNAHDGTCVLVVHHAGKGESTESRGSTVIEDAPDSVFKLSGDEIHIMFETVKQRDTVKYRRLSFHLEAVPGTTSAVILPGRGYVTGETDGQVTASVEMQTRDIFMTHFENTGCTTPEWRAAVMEKLSVSRSTAQEYINKALEDWDAVKKVEGGKGKADRFEVA